MSYQRETPFDSVESAHEYLALLVEVVLDAQRGVEADLSVETAGPTSLRRAEALQLVLYNLQKLEKHLKASRRGLNDLRSLRRLLLQERSPDLQMAMKGSSKAT